MINFHRYLIRCFDLSISIPLMFIFLPSWSYQVIKYSLAHHNDSLVIKKTLCDDQGNTFNLYSFRSKPFSRSLWLLTIFKGNMSFAGSALYHQKSLLRAKPGLFNQVDINRKVGIEHCFVCL